MAAAFASNTTDVVTFGANGTPASSLDILYGKNVLLLKRDTNDNAPVPSGQALSTTVLYINQNHLAPSDPEVAQARRHFGAPHKVLFYNRATRQGASVSFTTGT